MYTSTCYQLTHDYGNYSHSEVLLQSPIFQDVKDYFDEAVAATHKGDYWETDNISIESIVVALNEDGEIEEVLDYLDVVEEHLFHGYWD